MRWQDNEQPSANEAVFRSAPMTLVQFYVTIEIARDVVFALGLLGQVHFRDLNSKLTPFQRTFVSELRDVDAMEIQFEFLHNAMVKYGTLKGDPFATLMADKRPLPPTSEIDDIKSTLETSYEKIKHLDGSYTSLEVKRSQLIENRHVLNLVNNFHRRTVDSAQDDEFRQFEIEDLDDEDEEALLGGARTSLDVQETSVNLDESVMHAITGTIARTKIPILRKILWRTLRGNLYFNDIPIIDDDAALTGSAEHIDKNVFIIYTHGDYLKSRVRRIIHSLDGFIYDNVEGSSSSRQVTLSQLNNKIEDLTSVIDSTKSHLVSELIFFQEKYPDWHYIIKREKAIYETLNKFDEDSTRRCLVGEGWIPLEELRSIRHSLKALVRSKAQQSNRNLLEAEHSISLSTDTLANTQNEQPSNSYFAIGRSDYDDNSNSDDDDDQEFSFVAVVNELTTNRVPPTYHKTNKFTSGFQAIVDTYGIASYQEVNPGLATIITFPFMFAIMFGDLGHGFIVLLVALFFIVNETKFNAMRKKDEIFEMAFNGRYIILLMGLFSMYTGLMYNDIFSKSMTLFASGWKWVWPEGYDPHSGPISLTAVRVSGKTYPIGLDWIWHGAENGLLFTNSYKMKMSILMGYCHMNYSLMFSLVNYRFFKSLVDIIGNFLPGFFFMQSIFGYLALTIVYKWCVDWFGTNRQPPGLLNMLINMFLAPGSIEDPLYSGQKFVQIVLVLIALCCVPWLLLYKPIVLNKKNKRAKNLGFDNLKLQQNHFAQAQEEELAFERLLNSQGPDNRDDDGDLNEGDEIDELSQTFTFPNDVEPMNLSSGHGHGEEDFNLMDVVIHQVIHTIEFCLNCVSHTASYLRLWALSLAHAQLSSVLWTMTIQNAFGTKGLLGIAITVCLFAMWFVLTVCILVLMEGTSAMLHSLRLHWVEAMSKFFEGEGYAYEPFSFSSIDY
ncbi:hypothetical protein PUMCH_000361 [Australozyma saopauloensis]|uniref:V-type proton ATPase subunit a n=1 Tax=Australozyma saopauloensis TaxID=291208 RepID=A0AAX4H4M3_9ASCO|nr:hypothetical protein PUMCH_000361 [[Candida] saopauloensis]